MRPRFVLPLGALITAFVLAVAFVPSTAESATQQFTLPVEATVYDQCNLEDVRLSGNNHINLRSRYDGNFGFHERMHSNYYGVTGLGLISGRRYTAHQIEHSTWHARAPWPHVRRHDIRIRLVPQGGGQNLSLTIRDSVTTNALGYSVVNSNVMDLRCW